jgi:hypothetical protein
MQCQRNTLAAYFEGYLQESYMKASVWLLTLAMVPIFLWCFSA